MKLFVIFAVFVIISASFSQFAIMPMPLVFSQLPSTSVSPSSPEQTPSINEDADTNINESASNTDTMQTDLAGAVSQSSNQTSAAQMTDKLLSLTFNFQRALNEDNQTAVAESVGQIQGTLLNALEAQGKQVVIVPSDIISPNAEDTPADTALNEELPEDDE